MGVLSVIDPRGLGARSRGLENRISTPKPPPQQEYPRFAVEALGFLGPAAIADALAYALKWQIDFAKLPDPPDERKQDFADKLLAIWKFLVQQEVISPRDPDGTLLIDDWRKRMGHVKGKVTFTEVAYNRSVPVAEIESDPFDPWAPTLFPSDLSDETRRRYPARPKNLDKIPPFFPDIVALWQMASAYRAPPPKPPAVDISDVIKTDPWAFRQVNDDLEQGPTDLKEVKAALEKVERALNREDIARAQLEAASGPTPTINRAVGTLAKVTLNDIALQTGVDFNDAWSDQPLLPNTEVILYHTVFSFVLNKHGEPFDMYGRLDYPILVPEPGSQMRRQCPPPGGVFVSVQKYGFQNYRIEKGKIDKVLFGGVGGFEEYGYGYSGKHDFHKRIQAFIDQGSHTFIAGVSMPAINDREEITLDRITTRLPEFAEAVIPPFVKEVRARAKNKIENWQDFVEQIAYEVIKGIIVSTVKTYARNYIIKKIGARIVPGLNAAAAIYDLATGGGDRLRMRNAIACIIVALKSRSDEDMTIAAKVCAKIAADQFEDEIMKAIVQAGQKAAEKAGRHIAMKLRKDKAGAEDGPGATADEGSDQPKPSPKPPSADSPKPDSPAAPTSAGSPSTPAPKTQSPPAADNLGITPHGPADHKAPISAPKPATASPNAQAVRAVADTKRKIQEDMRRQAEQAVAQSSASNAGTQSTGDAGKKPSARRGTANTAATAGARETDDKADTATGTADATSGHQQYIRSQQYGPARDIRARPPRADAGDTTQTPAGPPQPIKGKGTSDDPHVYPPQPVPTQPTVRPKDQLDLPEPGLSVNDQMNPRTGRASPTDVQRANRDADGDPLPPDHDSHHGVPKASGGATGESIRDTLSTTGVSVNAAENTVPARGVSRDTGSATARGTVHDTAAGHSDLHGEDKLGPMDKILATRTGDEEAVRGALSDAARIHSEGGTVREPEFWLDPQLDRSTDDMPKGTAERRRESQRRRDDDPRPPPKKPGGGGEAPKQKK